MELKKVEVEVAKEAYELAMAAVAVVASVKKALADGWNPVMDLPVIILDSIKVLPEAIGGVDQLDDEWKANPDAFIKAFGVAAGEMASQLMKPPAS